MLVREVMSHQAVTVTRETSVREALAVLERHRISAAPVLDRGGRIEGVVSEADLIRDLVPPDQRTHAWPVPREHHDRPRTVGEVMTTHAVTVGPETDLAVAVDLMTTTGVKSLPVVDHQHHVLGVLSRSDVVRAISHSDDEIARGVDTILAEAGLGDWLVSVDDGEVQLSGPEGTTYATTARVLAESVPGVLAVRVQP